ncbi:hypothetical protein GCM10022228_12090 [Halomonas cibimaris]|uniref:Negative regulator of flagellin synthesis n=1 Tax=Halomonas cibimaris TaxID=657012 RepID=A0ABP7LK19_9GAMM
MKISHINIPPSPGQAPQRGEPQKAQREASAASQPPSSGVSHIRQQHVDTTQDIDTLRVEEIRSAIRDGKLEIHAERIAEGLINSLDTQ